MHSPPWHGDLLSAGLRRLKLPPTQGSTADRVRTPTLLHHGAWYEVRWPFHSRNYFAALETAGTPARLILYPGEGHDVMLPNSLELRDAQDLAWMQRFVRGVEER